MPRNRPNLELRFPTAGVVRRRGYADPLPRDGPYPTPWATNVRPEDPGTRRVRGGARPGLTKQLDGALGTAIPAMTRVVTAAPDALDEVLVALVDGELTVVDGSTATSPRGALATEAGLLLLTEGGQVLLAGSGSVPTGDVVLASRNQWVYAIRAAGVTAIHARTGVVDTLTTPAGCTHGCVYRDRLVLAGADNAIFASRQGDPTDWDYGADAEDAGRAVAFQLAEAAEIGDVVTALMPYADAYLLAATSDGLWILRGDPAAEGTLRQVSRHVGAVGPTAWCQVEGSLVFLARDGLYRVGADGSDLTPLSEQSLPQELQDLDGGTTSIALVYSHSERGVYLFLTPATGAGTHWFYDLVSGGFWPDIYQEDHQPQSACQYGQHVLLAGQDGYLRRIGGDDDDGEAIPSHLLLGPVRFGPATVTGLMREVVAALGEESGTVHWRVITGGSAEDVAERGKEAIEKHLAGDTVGALALTRGGGTFTAGRGRVQYPRVHGVWFMVWLYSSAAWAYEWLSLDGLVAGRWR